MSQERITQKLLLPELRFIKLQELKKQIDIIHCEKVSDFEVCPKCATPAFSIYDHRVITVKDAPIRNKQTIFKIRKRGFYCKKCKKPFLEPVNGIRKGFRTTQRLRSHIRWCATKFGSLKWVENHVRCSSSLVYKAFYEQIELDLRKSKSSWPSTIGIDEHSFVRNIKSRRKDFVTVFIDYNNKRMKEVVLGKSIGDLMNSSISNIEGRFNVKNVVLDLSPTFRSFAIDYFPKARLIADKSHVVKLMHPLIHDRRKKLIDNNELVKKRTNPVIRMLLRYRKKLLYYQRDVLDKFLDLCPELKEIYWYQQRLYSIYRVKGYNRAKNALLRLLDDMGYSKISEVQSYRRTLKK